MNSSTFAVPKMDCPAEERLVRMALYGHAAVRELRVDLSAREVTVVHEGPAEPIDRALIALHLGARLQRTETGVPEQWADVPANDERRALVVVLAINAGMFVAEAIGAYVADSTALLADSLDMFADAGVYGIALYGATRGGAGQHRAARLSGYLQLALALGALSEVIRQLIGGSEPTAITMALVAVAALVANVTTMWLLARHRQGGPHMKASWIFTTNDVIANMGVIVAAGLVTLTGSSVPDLIVGTAIALVVMSGAIRILRLGRVEMND